MKVQGFADRDDLRLQCWRGFQKTCSPLGCRQVIVFFFPASVSQTSPYALQGGKTKRETKKKTPTIFWQFQVLYFGNSVHQGGRGLRLSLP